MIKYIVAVRIYFDVNNCSRADLLFNNGMVEYIDWKRNSQRKRFAKYITKGTLWFDERYDSTVTFDKVRNESRFLARKAG